MVFEVARTVEFRPKQCPKCKHYLVDIDRCEGYRSPSRSGLSGLTAMFRGETEKPCPRFEEK